MIGSDSTLSNTVTGIAAASMSVTFRPRSEVPRSGHLKAGRSKRIRDRPAAASCNAPVAADCAAAGPLASTIRGKSRSRSNVLSGLSSFSNNAPSSVPAAAASSVARRLSAASAIGTAS